MPDVNGLAAKVDALLVAVENLREENARLTAIVESVDPTVLDSIEAKVDATIASLGVPGA